MYQFIENMFKGKREELIETVKQNIYKENKMFIITANSEIFMVGEKEKKVAEILLSKKNIIIADGIGIVRGAKTLNIRLEEKIPGIELVESILEIVNQLNRKIYVYGSKQRVLNNFENIVNQKYPNINISGLKNGYENKPGDVFLDIINKEPDLVLVAMGVPKQELVIWENYDKIKKGIFIGVGGSIDVLSGSKKRAPNVFCKLNLEWLYRITTEPKRIGRFFKYNIKFLRVIKKEKKKKF